MNNGRHAEAVMRRGRLVESLVVAIAVAGVVVLGACQQREEPRGDIEEAAERITEEAVDAAESALRRVGDTSRAVGAEGEEPPPDQEESSP
jgi:hypothetical protein